MRKIVDFYEYEVSDEDIENAALRSSFENMKAIERSENFQEPWLRPRENAYKVRKGKVGGYQETLNRKDIEYLNAVFGLSEENRSYAQ